MKNEHFTIGVKRKLFVSTDPTDPIFVPIMYSFLCSSKILEQSYDYRYEKYDMFHTLT